MALLPSHPSDRTARRRAAYLDVPAIDRDGIEQVPPPASCLVLVAHPDDDCFGCSGTTAKWAAAGTAVDLVVATDGSKGSHDLAVSAADVAARREFEQRASAEVTVTRWREHATLSYPGLPRNTGGVVQLGSAEELAKVLAFEGTDLSSEMIDFRTELWRTVQDVRERAEIYRFLTLATEQVCPPSCCPVPQRNLLRSGLGSR